MNVLKNNGFVMFLVMMLSIMMLSACMTSQLETQPSDDLPTWLELEGTESELQAVAVTTYYVSGTGNDRNDGKSTATAFRTLQEAANRTNPGDTVLIMNGTYTNSEPGSIILNIDRSGSKGAYIRYKAYPGHTPVLQATQNWLAVKVDGAAYIMIEGLTLIGNSSKVAESQALTQIKVVNGKK